jgi:hypothetical protein
VRPIEFYHLAVASASIASSEAEHRTIVSRLYYGLHHEACCRYFRANPTACHLKFRNRHPELSRRFHDPTDPTAMQISYDLRDLKQLRGLADYDLALLRFGPQTLNSQQLMTTALNMAQRLLKCLDSLLPGVATDGCPCYVDP